MGCSLSGLSAIYDAVNTGNDIWINSRRLRVVRQIGEGGYAFVYLVKEVSTDRPQEQPRDDDFVAADSMYALKKVLIQSEEQLTLVRQEVASSSRFHHPNLLPLLDHSIINVKGRSPSEGSWSQEAYLLFPVHREGTLQDLLDRLRVKKKHLSPDVVLDLLRQICTGIQYMHSGDPPYAHNDIKPHNVLLSRKGSRFLAVVMDFGSATPARRQIRSRSKALELQEWAAQHCSAPYRAPELWDCPSNCDIDERSDVWSLGCTLFAIMYGTSPFEYSMGEAGGSLQLAAMSGRVQWPPAADPPFPESFHNLVTWMLNTQASLRPTSTEVLHHIDKLQSEMGPQSMNNSV